MTPEPRSLWQPTSWRFAAIRAAMMEAGGLITAKEAERRVLVLENAGLRGQSKGFATSAYRSTDATVFVPIEGYGRSVISVAGGVDMVVTWGKRDVFVVPSWHRVRHEAAEDSVLFSFSDRPTQQALHLFREDRGNAKHADETGRSGSASVSFCCRGCRLQHLTNLWTEPLPTGGCVS